jgi:hypothetical protein
MPASKEEDWPQKSTQCTKGKQVHRGERRERRVKSEMDGLASHAFFSASSAFSAVNPKTEKNNSQFGHAEEVGFVSHCSC